MKEYLEYYIHRENKEHMNPDNLKAKGWIGLAKKIEDEFNKKDNVKANTETDLM